MLLEFHFDILVNDLTVNYSEEWLRQIPQTTKHLSDSMFIQPRPLFMGPTLWQTLQIQHSHHRDENTKPTWKRHAGVEQLWDVLTHALLRNGKNDGELWWQTKQGRRKGEF